MKFFNELVDQSISRARESTLSVLSLCDDDLREHLAAQFKDELGAEGCFLAPPVFEHTFGWESAEQTLLDLSGSIFSPQLLSILAKARNYSFSSNLNPYVHQLKAWKTLTNTVPQSAVITSGTGSGKTECFMLPIIDDLIRETESSGKALVGVRALFLYPLNALINSQKERLDAWTESYDDRVRFCLYNGMTEESASKVRKEQQEHPNQILSRQLLRTEPAPILMTNSTMLEYMLVRQVDQPILEISRENQSLRWIVLDEAHTYIGSSAAEMSLLLRRVVHAFGRIASEIRFVATSATISGEEAKDRLAQYLADLAGVDVGQVSVIGGNRVWPSIAAPSVPESISLRQVEALDPGSVVSTARFKALTLAAVSSTIRDVIVRNASPLNLNEIVEEVAPQLQSTSRADQQREVLEWLNVMTGTYPGEDDFDEKESAPFLKVRCHLYQRMLHGLWACVNPVCMDKPELLSSWPFGNVYVDQRTRCNCGSPVFELAFCTDCSEPHLLAEDKGGILCQPDPYAGDEFALTYHEDEGGDDDLESHAELGGPVQKLVVSRRSAVLGEYFEQNLNLATAEYGVLAGDNIIRVVAAYEEGACCSLCERTKANSRGFYRRAHLGAPFYVANTVPTVLEFCPDPDKSYKGNKSPEELPGRGRNLITFTDSRQGTARMAVRMQQEAERSRLRGLVFESLRNAQSKSDNEPQDVPTESPEKLLELAKQLEQAGMASNAKELRLKAEQLLGGGEVEKPTVELSWSEMVESISEAFDVAQSILDYNKYTNPVMFENEHGAKMMSRMLLAREFSRRPKTQNSMETLGLVTIGYQGIRDISTTPEFWTGTSAIAPGRGNDTEDTNLTLQDWKDFLTVTLDFYVRENTFLGLDRTMQRWMGGRFVPKVLFPPQSSVQESATVKRWPFVRKGVGARLQKLLQLASGANLETPVDRDKLNVWLEAAWLALVKSSILEPADSGHRLNLNTLTFALPRAAWVCPATQKLVPTTFRSLTPYLPLKISDGDYRCEKRSLPDLAAFKVDGGIQSKNLQIRSQVSSNNAVRALRKENLWTDICDRTVEGGFYYRTAEHSAQQSSKKLERYEELFKDGKINVLNCSTTMEMGVDIGGITAVVMNNLPPHPANYLQRSGRAGRRKETRSIAYTLCKADPHNQRAFRNPQWPFKTAIPAPHITLSSDRIVQRHVNSFFLADYLSSFASEGDGTKLNVKWFFGGDNSPCNQFVDWLRAGAVTHEPAVVNLVRGTALEHLSFSDVVTHSINTILDIQDRWLADYGQINSKVKFAKEDAYKRALELELKRHQEEYLLRDLSARAFLPGHGFPTDVVSLNTYNIEDFIDKANSKKDKSREDNVFSLKELPSRELSIAIREYAPGAQVVIDGRVYSCAGVSLQWQPGGFAGGVQKFDVAWRCRKCGSTGVAANAYANSEGLSCTNCQKEILTSEQRTILRPNGFLTDFFESTSNDISSQKYIRVEKPRIQLEGGDIVSFPDASCGHVRYGHSGTVFHHSSGDNEKGYAVCLSCGKAVSLTSTGEIPAKLGMRPDEEHRPLGGLTGSHKAKDCSGAAVKKDLYLGYQVQTDVAEFYLSNPATGQWLSDSSDDQVIATTFAVAIRDVIAEKLGIASTEMGFSTRPDKDLDTGVGRSVIQLFDQVSGGAGFVLAELGDVVTIVEEATAKLDCPKHCENVCSHCLAHRDSRVEQEKIDRHAARQWLSDTNYLTYLRLPSGLSNIPGAVYSSFGPLHSIQKALRLDASKSRLKLVFTLSGDIDDWDLDDSQFRVRILKWVFNDNCEVWLGVPNPLELSATIKRSLSVLSTMGVQLFMLAADQDGYGESAYRVAQVYSSEGCLTLYSTGDSSSIPGPFWLDTFPTESWATTEEVPYAVPQAFDAASIAVKKEGATVIEITNELDGDVIDLSSKISAHLKTHVPQLTELLEQESPSVIRYTDRYVKSPWSAMLLGEFLQVFSSPQLKEIFLETMSPNKKNVKQRSSTAIDHDWPIAKVQSTVLSKSIFDATGVKPIVRLHESARNIPHGRFMKLDFPSGKECAILFDQGMGYWEPTARHRDHLNFNFGTNAEHQPDAIARFRKRAACRARGKWPTYFIVTVGEEGQPLFRGE